MKSELRNKTVKGLAWSSVQKIGSMSISFVANLILARMLTPEDFGCIGIMLVFINVSNVFIDAGFGAALIQRKETNDVDYSTIFYWNIFVAIALYVILWFSAPLISRFYEIAVLKDVLRVLGIVLITNALSLVHITKLKKLVEFKIISLSFVFATVLAFIVTIIMAYYDYGIWSLVAFQIVQSAVNTALLWVWVKWIPLLDFSLSSFKQLFSYGSFLLLSSLIGTVSKQFQSLFIGKICSTSTLGYYTQAKNLENAPTNVIYSVVGQVAFPLFASKQNDKEELQDIYCKIFSCISYITMPIMALLMIVAEPLFVFLYSEKWLPSVPYFQLLCIAGTVSALTDINIFLITAVGKSKLIFKWSMINNMVAITLILIGTVWSIYGIIAGVIISAFYSFFVYSILINKYLGIGFARQNKEPICIFTTCAILMTVLYVLKTAILGTGMLSSLSIGAVFLFGYPMIVYLLKLDSQRYIWAFLKSKMAREV